MVSDGSPRLAASLALAEAIGRSTRVDQVFDAALDAIEHGLHITRAAFLLFDPDGVMRFKASRGLSEGYRRAVEGHTPWAPREADAQALIVPDVRRAADLSSLLDVILAEGIASMAFVPLVSVGGVIGKCMLYFDQPTEMTPEDLQLARVFAAQAAFAVDNLRAQATAVESHAAHLDMLEQSGRVADRLAAIVESSTDAIVSKNLDGVIMSWNRSAERIFGYTAEEAIGQSVDLIIPDDRRAEEQMVLDRIRSGQGVELETVRRRKDGSPIDIALSVSPMRNRSGAVVGASKIARDITERKRSEAELADLHARLRMLVDASASLLGSPDEQAVHAVALGIARRLLSADGYAIWKLDGAPGSAGSWRVALSAGISDDFSARSVDLADSTAPAAMAEAMEAPRAVMDVTTHPIVETQLTAYQAEGIRSILVFYYRTPHLFRDVEIETAQTLANLAAAALATADLYQRERSQRQLAEAATRRAAFLADASVVLSRSLDYEHTLAAVAQLAVPTIADWCLVDMVAEDGQLERLAMSHADSAKLDRARELGRRYPRNPRTPGGAHEVVRTGRPVLFETVSDDLISSAARDRAHLALLKSLEITSYICVPLVTPNGAIGALTFVYAGSGRHYTADDLQFAQSVAARASLAIDNARAYQRASEANRLKDEFLATLSHELRTPLNAILGYAQMLDMGMLGPDRQRQALAVLVRNGETLRQIIDDVLDISRIVAGKLRLKMQPIDLAAIIENAAATVQPAADAKGVTVQLIDAAVAPISGDPDRLQQVVWNLLSNAVKFTPRGGRVQVRLDEVDAFVQISVTDTGRGIDPAFLPHIFERFRQADSRFSREHGGLGLGLAIVRELVELHGGNVTASSRGVGTGATFRVRLPARVAPPDARRASAPEGGNTYAQHRLDGVRVLAVDDEADSLDLVRILLENAGAGVTAARSATEALEALRTAPFDVMLADIGMPGMDGLDLIRAVRETLPAPANQVPAAALTAYARAEDRISALASGFQMHIPKPVNTVELIIAVSALVSRAPARS